ncbi:MAG: exopolysaccharide transporter [Saprospirales bacterium]|nr:exopolysaccharide transporter [Saprospirales bacterium]
MVATAGNSPAIANRQQWILVVLVLLLGMRIASYFTLFPNSVAMTQLVKTAGRLALTGSSFLLYKYLQGKYQGYQIKIGNLTPLILYLAYLFLGLLSFFWSSKVSYSALQWAMVTEALVFAWFYTQALALYNAISDNHVRFTFAFGRATMFICIAFILGLIFDPETYYRQTHGGEVSRLGGFIINPNELGMLAVLGCTMAYYELLAGRSKFINSLVLISSVAVLLLTQSRSSLGAFLLLTGFVLLRTGNMRLIFFAGLGAALVLPILVQTIILKQGDVEEVMSMTGRLPFWKDLITDGFPARPLFGYGFMRIAPHDYFPSIHSYAAKMTHNTFVQVLLNLGLVGSFICLLQMVATFFTIGRCPDKDLKWLANMMLIPVIINSFTEFGIFGESNYGIQFYQLIILFFVISVVKNPPRGGPVSVERKIPYHASQN